MTKIKNQKTNNFFNSTLKEEKRVPRSFPTTIDQKKITHVARGKRMRSETVRNTSSGNSRQLHASFFRATSEQSVNYPAARGYMGVSIG